MDNISLTEKYQNLKQKVEELEKSAIQEVIENENGMAIKYANRHYDMY